jgi:hypothetical protein
MLAAYIQRLKLNEAIYIQLPAHLYTLRISLFYASVLGMCTVHT